MVGFFVTIFTEYPSPGEMGGGKGVGMVHKEKQKNFIGYKSPKNKAFTTFFEINFKFRRIFFANFL